MGELALVGAIVGITAFVAILDFATSAEFIGSILFTFPLALCAKQRSRRLLWGTAAATVVPAKNVRRCIMTSSVSQSCPALLRNE